MSRLPAHRQLRLQNHDRRRASVHVPENARRDSFLAKDQQLFSEVQPLKLLDPDSYPLKHTKGRTRARKLAEKHTAVNTG